MKIHPGEIEVTFLSPWTGYDARGYPAARSGPPGPEARGGGTRRPSGDSGHFESHGGRDTFFIPPPWVHPDHHVRLPGTEIVGMSNLVVKILWSRPIHTCTTSHHVQIIQRLRFILSQSVVQRTASSFVIQIET